MATLAVGSGAARLIAVAAIPVLTRLYGPEDFGILSVFTALVSIMMPVLTLRYALAVPLPRHDGTAMNLMALSALLGGAMTLGISFILWVAGEPVLALFSAGALSSYWWLIALGLVAAAGYELLTMWATRRRAYKPIAQTQVLQSALGSLVKIVLGLLALKPLGLLIGQVVSTGAGTGTLSQRFAADFRRNRKHIGRRRLLLVARRYAAFPVYRLPSQFLLVFATQAPLLLCAALYDIETTGQLGLALMALTLPMTLLARTMSKAYYAEIAAIGARKPEVIRALTMSVIKRLFLLSLGPAVVLFIFAPDLFLLAFGSDWHLAGQLASILSIFLIFQFIQAPVAHILYVFEGQKLLLLLNIQRSLLTLLSFSIAYFVSLEIKGAIMIYAILLAMHYAFSIFRSLKEIPRLET